MTGKGSLLMVMGFIIILTMYITNMSRRSVRAVDNMVDNYVRIKAHQIAISGMNIAASKLYQNFSWRSGMSNIPFQKGNLSIYFGAATDTVEVIVVSAFRGYADTVRAYFAGSGSFTDYTAYTDDENGMAWTPGDTVWGPIHTNDVLNHQNNSSIVFYGKVTAGKNIASPPKNAKTKFLGGYEVGVYLPTVSSINGLINAAGAGGYTFPSPSDTMKLEFKAGGNVVVWQNSTAVYPDPGINIYSLAPNGAIYSAGIVEIIGGIVNTTPMGAVVSSGSNIIFRDEVYYADNPETNPNSDDMIAFAATDYIYFDNQTKSNWYMQAVLMAANQSLSATVMNKNGTFNYYGSYYQKRRGNAKMFQSFNKKYKYDVRLRDKRPPFYPGMSNLKLISWWE